MKIAIIAHDEKKELIAQFCIAYCGILSKHQLCGTARTARIVSEATGIDVEEFMSGEQGGGQQIASRIGLDEIDMLLLFRDHMNDRSSNVDDVNLLRLCDMHRIPFATNLATAEMLVHGLERGDLDWRNIVRKSAIM